ncbi:MAG: type III pantothenate kinase [Bacteroidota bacterium]
MNLVIDIGNSFTKYAIFDNRQLVYFDTSESAIFVTQIKQLFEAYPKIQRAIISAVGPLQNKEKEIMALFCKVHVLSHASKVPFKNSYASPSTLGMDRIALATSAFYQYPRKNVLVIDMGTCVTYDFVNDAGEYRGGAISPGLNMRYRAMHLQTDKLPLLQPEELLDFVGNSTASSMHSGVINGLTLELDGVISQYHARFQDLTVILTGGDSQFFVKRLKNSIFANSKFLVEGLNYLLEYNKS